MASLKDLVGKAIIDANFRKQLSENPAQALSGFDLSEDEKALFKNIHGHEDLSALLARLSVEPRVSKSSITFGKPGSEDPWPKGGS